jgi:succinate-semialdehyde dehydrogenase/glutarate-semialdehyde dehydrogenase
MAETRLVDALHDQVERAVAAGGRLRTGGHVSARGSNYYQPTLISEIPVDAPVLREEFFGPVALLFRVADLDEAIAVANKTPFGLSASVWTNDPAEQERCIDELETGQVFVNAMTVSDARVPFGGIKRSGIGRELGPLGLHEFVNAKAVTCK